MEEIARFLKVHPPFSQLPTATVQRLAGVVQIEYFAAGHDILVEGGAPAEFLYMIRRGHVDYMRRADDDEEWLETHGEGEMFGYISLVRGKPPILTVRAREEVLAYLLPAAWFHRLRAEYAAFELFFARSITRRLTSMLEEHHANAAPELFNLRLRDLIARPLVSVSPDTSIAAAARLMVERDVSSLVVPVDPPGIVTDRDLRTRVLATGRDPGEPLSTVMTCPALTLPASSPVFEGLMLMTERSIHHLPVTDNGQVVGMVTRADILRRQTNSPVFLPRVLHHARGPDDLRDYKRHVITAIRDLVEAGVRVADIHRIVSVAHDALVQRLIGDAEAELGPPPCPYAWLELGSSGRREQTLRTDQDNAIIYADGAPPEAAHYFARLAERLVGWLEACGYPRCKGGVMAVNAEWCQPLGVWQGYFRRWIATPEEEALLKVAIFFDFRPIHGTLDVEAELRPIIAHAQEQRVFLGRLARAALRNPAPLGLFHQVQLERRGGERDLLDLKMRGTAPIADLARLFALESGNPRVSTRERLVAGASLDAGSAEELCAAFDLISFLRLRHQVAQTRHGDEPDNIIHFARLSALERRNLKDALRVIERAQKSVAAIFQTSKIA